MHHQDPPLQSLPFKACLRALKRSKYLLFQMHYLSIRLPLSLTIAFPTSSKDLWSSISKERCFTQIRPVESSIHKNLSLQKLTSLTITIYKPKHHSNQLLFLKRVVTLNQPSLDRNPNCIWIFNTSVILCPSRKSSNSILRKISRRQPNNRHPKYRNFNIGEIHLHPISIIASRSQSHNTTYPLPPGSIKKTSKKRRGWILHTTLIHPKWHSKLPLTMPTTRE